jgi:glycerol-3-phosphate dehydrogenase
LIHEDGKSPSELSRKDEVFLSNTGLITIAGGKLTGYRLMAKKVVDEVCNRLNIAKECTTDQVKLNGFPSKDLAQKLKSTATLDDLTVNYLMHVYGEQSIGIVEQAKANDEELIAAEAQFCIDHEMCLNPYDFFVRRTGRMYFDIDSVKASKVMIGKLFAKHYQWSEVKLTEEMNKLDQEIKERSTFQ